MRQVKIEVQTGAFFSMKDRPESALDKGFSEVLQFVYCKILHIDDVSPRNGKIRVAIS
jgi:hypothetical protein